MARIKPHLIFNLSLLLYWITNENQIQADSSHFTLHQITFYI